MYNKLQDFPNCMNVAVTARLPVLRLYHLHTSVVAHRPTSLANRRSDWQSDSVQTVHCRFYLCSTALFV